ncbi:MAG: 3-deoxy-manno-octulosonate cytidylyltransferase [Gammaproteobacteria bacterium]|nr:3-deoxy-manno-octulosonate cytidylyltransferase [Gammaproteobacteria bacterium]
MTDSYNIVIPARIGSSRFPGKPLHRINGHPMLAHVVQRARESAADQVIVATDDEKILQCCEDIGVDAMMTDAAHVSGTDRIAEVAEKLRWNSDTIIVGLQGDEPATEPAHLDRLAQNLRGSSIASMATFCVPVSSENDLKNPDRVKVVMDCDNLALYFSRAPIPYARDKQGLSHLAAYVHVGLYAYRCGFLHKFSKTPPAALEVLEQLEQLRVLANGGRIHVDVLEKAHAAGVDRMEDVEAVAKLLRERFQQPGA